MWSCQPGSYQSGQGKSYCSGCPAGKSSPGVSVACTTCDAGKYSGAGSSTCLDCPAGTYSKSGSKGCSSCAAGSYQNYQGQGQCTLCDAGKFQSNAKATGCLDCNVGQVSSTGATECTTCPAGQYAGSNARAEVVRYLRKAGVSRVRLAHGKVLGLRSLLVHGLPCWQGSKCRGAGEVLRLSVGEDTSVGGAG